MTGIKKYIGDRSFYKSVLLLVIPVIIQQGITSFVNLLDNIMVGALGTEAISAVSISNQILLIFQLAVFGGISGISIFSAQYYGKGDMEGMRYTFRTKVIFFIVLAVVSFSVLKLFGGDFVSLFLQGDSNGKDMALALESAMSYLNVILIGFIPFILTNVYATTLRETGETFVPMLASSAAILINLTFNWLLIYGNLGFPKWGVFGAAVATSLSRFVELTILIIYTHSHKEKYVFMKGAYSSLYVPVTLLKSIAKTGTPLLVNEILWSFGMTMISQSYSTRGLDVVAATNIAITAWDIFMIAMVAMGNAVQIMVGQHLGMGRIEEAKDIDRKLVFLTLVLNSCLGVVLFACSGAVPMAFKVDDHIRLLATQMLIIDAFVLPIEALVHVAYFTIRSGGRTLITFFFDSVYTMLVPVMLSFFLCRFSSLEILTIFAIVQFSNIIKMVIGLLMVKNGFWARRIV